MWGGGIHQKAQCALCVFVIFAFVSYCCKGNSTAVNSMVLLTFLHVNWSPVTCMPLSNLALLVLKCCVAEAVVPHLLSCAGQSFPLPRLHLFLLGLALGTICDKDDHISAVAILVDSKTLEPEYQNSLQVMGKQQRLQNIILLLMRVVIGVHQLKSHR